jgi:hypothetical protein
MESLEAFVRSSESTNLFAQSKTLPYMKSREVCAESVNHLRLEPGDKVNDASTVQLLKSMLKAQSLLVGERIEKNLRFDVAPSVTQDVDKKTAVTASSKSALLYKKTIKRKKHRARNLSSQPPLHPDAENWKIVPSDGPEKSGTEETRMKASASVLLATVEGVSGSAPKEGLNSDTLFAERDDQIQNNFREDSEVSIHEDLQEFDGLLGSFRQEDAGKSRRNRVKPSADDNFLSFHSHTQSQSAGRKRSGSRTENLKKKKTVNKTLIHNHHSKTSQRQEKFLHQRPLTPVKEIESQSEISQTDLYEGLLLKKDGIRFLRLDFCLFVCLVLCLFRGLCV